MGEYLQQEQSYDVESIKNIKNELKDQALQAHFDALMSFPNMTPRQKEYFIRQYAQLKKVTYPETALGWLIEVLTPSRPDLMWTEAQGFGLVEIAETHD